MERKTKINYYLDIAQTVATRATCLRRHFGAIIVRNDVIVSTGYNGAPRGRKNCSDMGECLRDRMKIPRGERYELCRSVHAEANAIIAAPRESMLGADLFLCCLDPATGKPVGGTTSCQMCKRLVINAGISRVFVREDEENYSVYNVEDWITNDDSLGQIGY
jgi:dCMP deaminase